MKNNPSKPSGGAHMKKEILLLLLIIGMPFAAAVDFNTTISDQDKQAFDQMLVPVMKIYNLVKYAATVIATLILLFAGVSYMISGNDPKKRETAKSMVMYVVIGLIVIWGAPLIVKFLVG